jgi:hypothetical protein
MEPMSTSLLEHWNDSLRSCSSLLEKVYRFLILFYGNRAGEGVIPRLETPVAVIQMDPEVRPKLPRSSEEIRSLIARIAEAVGRAVPPDS